MSKSEHQLPGLLSPTPPRPRGAIKVITCAKTSHAVQTLQALTACRSLVLGTATGFGDNTDFEHLQMNATDLGHLQMSATDLGERSPHCHYQEREDAQSRLTPAARHVSDRSSGPQRYPPSLAPSLAAWMTRRATSAYQRLWHCPSSTCIHARTHQYRPDQARC